MTLKEQRELTELLKEQARLQQEVSRSIEDYMKGVEDLKTIQKTINKNKQIELQIEREIASLTGDEKVAAEIKLKILKEQTAEMEKQGKALQGALASVNKKSLAGAKLMGEAAKGLGKAFVGLPGLIQSAYGKIKGLGLFELDKSMKQSALSMGILSKGTEGFRATIKGAALQTNMIGIGIKELSVLQSTYSEQLGRTVEMSQQGLTYLGQMAAATGLGAEGAAQMAAEFENQGLSAERTGQFIEQTMNDTHKMGLNATKVVKNIQSNIKMLNRYNFKDGVKGLSKMAALVSKLGVSMEFATGMADKLWDVEGAVDMSAQLQVMGGEWAKMADPFHLMYMARNDMAGLTEELGNAAAASAKFNSKTGEFDLGAMEMHKLKIIAEQTGVAYDDLVTAGKNAAKYTKIKSQLNFSLGGGKDAEELKEFITNKSVLNKNGEASIMINGQPKLLKQMNEQDKQILKAQMAETATMEERAKQASTFDEQITYLINQLKVFLLPLVETMNKNLIPKLQGLSDKFTMKGGWGEKIEKFATMVGEWVSSIAGFMIEWPKLTAGLYLFAKAAPTIGKVIGFFWERAKWFGNGIQLGLGFNSVASAGGGGDGGDITDMLGNGKKGGRFSKMFGKSKFGRLRSASKIGKFAKGWGGAGAGLLSAGLSGYDEYTSNSEAGMDTGENVGRTATRATTSGLGAWGGAAGGAAIGTMIFPGVGTAIGGLLGGIIGGLAGDKVGDIGGDALFGGSAKKGLHDGLFSSPVHDATFGMVGSAIGGALGGPLGALAGGYFGSDFSEGRGVIQGGKITPIDNKDDLLAMKKGGAIDKASQNASSNVHHTFGEMTINGSITVQSPGNPGASVDLMKNGEFKREITRVITSELEKQKAGGKNKGQ
jgi:hypothetical protein